MKKKNLQELLILTYEDMKHMFQMNDAITWFVAQFKHFVEIFITFNILYLQITQF